MRALCSQRPSCSHNVSQKVKRIRRFSATNAGTVFQEPKPEPEPCHPNCAETHRKPLLEIANGGVPGINKQGSTPTPWGAGSARPNPKMGAPDPENPLFLGFSVLRGGLRPWSQTMVSEGARPWGRGRSGDCEGRGCSNS